MKETKKKTTEKPEKKEKIPWEKIRHDYITGDYTYSELSKRYKVSLESIKKQARKTDKRKGWVSLKREHLNKVYEKAAQKEAEKAAKALVTGRQRAKTIAEDLIKAMETAVAELSSVLVEHQTVTKETKYEGKNVTETVTTVKDVEMVEGLINTKSLKNISESLKTVVALLDETDPEEDKFGIIELPQIEIPVPPSDEEPEKGGVEESGTSDTAEEDNNTA